MPIRQPHLSNPGHEYILFREKEIFLQNYIQLEGDFGVCYFKIIKYNNNNKINSLRRESEPL